MASTRTRLSSRGMRDLLNSGEVEDELRDRMERVLSKAQADAPVASGEYQASLEIFTDHTDRVVVRVGSDVDHAMVVEANTGNLARALDAAG